MKHWFYISVISDMIYGIPIEASSYEAAAEVVQRNYRRFIDKYHVSGLRGPMNARERKDHQKLGRLVDLINSSGKGTLRVIVEPKMPGDDGNHPEERQPAPDEREGRPIPDEEIDAILEDLDELLPKGAVRVPRKVRH